MEETSVEYIVKASNRAAARILADVDVSFRRMTDLCRYTVKRLYLQETGKLKVGPRVRVVQEYAFEARSPYSIYLLLSDGRLIVVIIGLREIPAILMVSVPHFFAARSPDNASNELLCNTNHGYMGRQSVGVEVKTCRGMFPRLDKPTVGARPQCMGSPSRKD